MSLRDLILGRVGIWGNPFHGLVVGSQLTLPDASTKAWTQPSGGDVDVVKAASPPGITRSVDELAYDASLGHEWRNYALISGTTRQLYGRALGTGAWVYLPAAGNAFRLQLASTLSASGNASGGAVSLRFSIKPMFFGEGAAAITDRTLDVSLSNIGQPQWNGSADFTPSIALATQSETGAKALFTVSYSGAIVGWLLATVIGTTQAGISIALSVWKTRAETLYRTGTGGTTGGDTYGGPCNGPTNSHLYAASVETVFEREEVFLVGVGFDGETAIPLIVKVDQDYTETYTSAWTCTGIYPDEPGSSSGSLIQSDRVEVFAGATSLGWAGYNFALGPVTGDSVYGIAATQYPTITWTGWDGTVTTLSYTSGSYRYFTVPTDYDANLAQWLTDSTDAALATRFASLFTSATPAECYLSIMGSGVAQVDLGPYGRSGYAAGVRPLGKKLLALAEKTPAGSSITRAATPYGAHAVAVAISTWSAQASAKGSHQPETNEISLHATAARCWV
jgi:hypothetical protein